MTTIDDFKNKDNFFLMAGPCAIEGEDMAMHIAEKIVCITKKLNIPYIFKGSYRKANRSRVDSFTGIGNEKALKILRKVGETFHIPTVTDIHEAHEAPWLLNMSTSFRYRLSFVVKPTYWLLQQRPERLSI